MQFLQKYALSGSGCTFAIFAEVHPDPDRAFSDAANQLRLDDIEKILRQAIEIDKIIKSSK
jgi:2-dehydro-3-deoxyphosphooctonate aldolase (KDO 8-P synthase)